ncbi:MAG: hypothetical protein ACFCVG_00750 [Kineosporiaceae bacterium]
MAVVVLASGTGAPGVTTTCLGLALSWPRPVLLVDADPSGGSAILAGYLKGQVPHDRGLVDLALAYRHGDLDNAIREATIALPGSQVELLPGVRSHSQAATVQPLWEPLAQVLAGMGELGVDVLVDAGRVGMAGTPWPLITSADLVALATRTTLPAVAGARSAAGSLAQRLRDAGTEDALGVVVIGPGRPYSTREVGRVLGMDVLAELAWDPASADVYHLGAMPRRRFAAAALPRSLVAAGEALRAWVEGGQRRLGIRESLASGT